MKAYKNVLVALELGKSDKKVIEKALEIKEQFKGHLTLLHAVEYMATYGSAYTVPIGIDIEDELQKEAKKMLVKVGNTIKVDEEHQIIRIGSAKQLILEEAKKMKADLIILGSHGRHGVQLLLGSTANGVLHNAPCDVLAVRI